MFIMMAMAMMMLAKTKHDETHLDFSLWAAGGVYDDNNDYEDEYDDGDDYDNDVPDWIWCNPGGFLSLSCLEESTGSSFLQDTSEM